MFKHVIEYTDYDGNARSEELYFNLSAPEMIALQRNTPGGYAEKLERVLNSNDPIAMIDTVMELIKKSYGKRSEDGTRFIKVGPDGRNLYEDFIETPAYEAFLLECITNGKLAANFVNDLIPQNTINKLSAALSDQAS